MVDLSEWESFYLIVGAASGALIGLQFVVLTLIADFTSGSGSLVESANFFVAGFSQSEVVLEESIRTIVTHRAFAHHAYSLR